ncbi:ACT domain-containing protein [Lactobacillus sp. S2-2]|uniref:ACT domain-containing protein n=1 Tax=Lactobacillus sp. S2-2 TaxID=2692917 RepID=UPI001F3ECA79|nr:ACT domain-containing protein [Lactobacillus sp. S2-2]
MNKYYIIDKSLLPETFDKVVKARELINNGEVENISEAVKKVGISRGSYYKYKDLVFESNDEIWNRKAVISFLLRDERGILSKVLGTISDSNASILTINQNIPIHNIASIVISLDLSNMHNSIDTLINTIKEIDGTSRVELVSIE